MSFAHDHFGLPSARPDSGRWTSSEHAILALGVALCLAVLLSKAVWGPTNAGYRALVREDGVLETAETLFYLAAAVVAGACAFRLRRHERVLALVYAALVAGLAFVAGEEISWGQRLFGIASPDFFQAYNRQAELNLHNLGPVQVILDYAYLTAGGVGGFGWLAVAAVGRVARMRDREMIRRLLAGFVAVALAGGCLAIAAALMLTPERVTELGLLRGAAGDAEALQRRLDHLAEYRLAAGLFGALLAALALAGLWRLRHLWAFLQRHGARMADFLIPGWPFVGFFVPLFFYYLAEAIAASQVEGPGLWGFIVLADEEAVEFLMSLGVVLFFLTRLDRTRRLAGEPAR